MDSTRRQKFAKLIRRELGELFQREGRDFFGKAFVTVTEVRVSPDLGVAKIYLSIFGVKNEEEIMENIVTLHAKEIRKRLGARIKHQVRVIPELIFRHDTSLDYAENIDRLLRESAVPAAAPTPEGRKRKRS